MKGAKNDFSMSFFVRDPEANNTVDKQVLFLKYVHNTESAIKWLKSHNIDWDYANVYDRRERKWLKREYNPLRSHIQKYHENKNPYA